MATPSDLLRQAGRSGGPSYDPEAVRFRQQRKADAAKAAPVAKPQARPAPAGGPNPPLGGRSPEPMMKFPVNPNPGGGPSPPIRAVPPPGGGGQVGGLDQGGAPPWTHQLPPTGPGGPTGAPTGPGGQPIASIPLQQLNPGAGGPPLPGGPGSVGSTMDGSAMNKPQFPGFRPGPPPSMMPPMSMNGSAANAGGPMGAPQLGGALGANPMGPGPGGPGGAIGAMQGPPPPQSPYASIGQVGASMQRRPTQINPTQAF